MASGKFVLRIPQNLHEKLRAEAHNSGCSLNSLVIQKIESSVVGAHQQVVNQIVELWEPVGVVLFGSTVRGESGDLSDIDLLIVLPADTSLTREQYRQWDEWFDQRCSKYSPHFVHPPTLSGPLGGLWLEVGLEGVVLYDPTGSTRAILKGIRNRIASGEYRRKTSHGHSYWVYQGLDDAK